MKLVKIKKNVDMLQINQCASILQKIRYDASCDKNWGSELPITDFAKAMACLNPQSYGGRIDKRLSDILGLFGTDDQDRGDRRAPNGDYLEWKGSFFTSSNKNLNLVQIRPWQNVNYLFYCFDIRNLDKIIMQLFYLTREQMENEMVAAGTISSSHGTKKANINNANDEKSLRIKADDPVYNRWVKDYGKSLDELTHLWKDKTNAL